MVESHAAGISAAGKGKASSRASRRGRAHAPVVRQFVVVRCMPFLPGLVVSECFVCSGVNGDAMPDACARRFVARVDCVEHALFQVSCLLPVAGDCLARLASCPGDSTQRFPSAAARNLNGLWSCVGSLHGVCMQFALPRVVPAGQHLHSGQRMCASSCGPLQFCSQAPRPMWRILTTLAATSQGRFHGSQAEVGRQEGRLSRRLA